MTKPRLNLMTNSMQKLTNILLRVDDVLVKLGETPYGVRKATPTEQRKAYEKLTPEELFGLIEKHGTSKVNTWLSKYEEKQ